MKEETKKNLNESIIKIRVELQKSKIKKSGKNSYAGFDYYELADFLPKLNELMEKEGVNDILKIENEEATLTLIKGNESQEYKMPFVLFDTPLTFKKNKSGEYMKNASNEYIQVPSMQDIQYLGALNTYYKRYLYLNAFGITDGEVIDSMDNENLNVKTQSKSTYGKITPKQLEMLQKAYTGDNLKKLLEINNLEKLEDMSMKKASEIIGKIIEKQKGEEK